MGNADYWEKYKAYQCHSKHLGGSTTTYCPVSAKNFFAYPRSPNWGVWNSVHYDSPGLPSVASRGQPC